MLDNATYQKLLNESRAAAVARLGDAPTYNADSENETLRKSLIDQINNREKFSYNINEDGLYNMYKDKAINQGRMAMRDTMGAAAGLTGGYGSSYGQAVGQQAYDRSLQSLNDVVPQLMGQALSIYQEEGNQLNDRLGIASGLVDEDWNRYRANMSDWLTNKEMAEAQAQADAKAAWDMEKENYSRISTMIAGSGYIPSDADLAAAGMSREQADALRNEYLRQTGQLPTTKSSGGGGRGADYYINGRPVWTKEHGGTGRSIYEIRGGSSSGSSSGSKSSGSSSGSGSSGSGKGLQQR